MGVRRANAAFFSVSHLTTAPAGVYRIVHGEVASGVWPHGDRRKGAATDIDRATSLPMDIHRGGLSAAVTPGGECRQSAKGHNIPLYTKTATRRLPSLLDLFLIVTSLSCVWVFRPAPAGRSRRATQPGAGGPHESAESATRRVQCFGRMAPRVSEYPGWPGFHCHPIWRKSARIRRLPASPESR